jgi:hypothetical protein
MQVFADAGVLQCHKPASPKLLQQKQQQQQQQQRGRLQEKGSKAKATARALLRRSGLQRRGTSTELTESAVVGTPSVRHVALHKLLVLAAAALYSFSTWVYAASVASTIWSTSLAA